ncbi:MAG: hypothetical protein K2X81_18970 [Candidatus Obscuribacterales bacterium]|nr:hypothetical protein [Candidatus Obscuribacterales bacterium]
MDESELEYLLRVRAAIVDSPENLAKLTPRERDLLCLRVGLDGGEPRHSFEIAELYGVNIARVQVLEARALRKLKALQNP